MSEVIWHGEEVIAKTKEQIGNNLERAAIFLVDRLVSALNVVPDRIVGNIYKHGIPPAEAGDPPHKVTGSLQRSVTYEMGSDRQSVAVGTNDIVGFWQEVGTPKQLARPWLRPTFAENQDTIGKIVSTGGK